MENKRCPNCGAIIEDKTPGKHKCAYCDTEYFISKESKTEQKVVKKRSSKVLLYAILIIVAVGTVLLLIGLLNKDSDTDNLDNNNEDIVEEIEEDLNYSSYEHAKVGDIVIFGTYEQDNNYSNGSEQIEWKVLSRTEDGVLLVSRYGLDCKKFNDVFEFTSWDDCDIRRWLNDEFYNLAFNDSEKKHIATTENDTEYACTKTSDDKVFLLSATEADKYFLDDDSRVLLATEYAKAQGVQAYDNGSCWWWLRSLCEDNEYVMNVRSRGNIRYSAEKGVSDEGYAVRPAIWVSFEEVIDDNTINNLSNTNGNTYVLTESEKNNFIANFDTGGRFYTSNCDSGQLYLQISNSYLVDYYNCNILFCVNGSGVADSYKYNIDNIVKNSDDSYDIYVKSVDNNGHNDNSTDYLRISNIGKEYVGDGSIESVSFDMLFIQRNTEVESDFVNLYGNYYHYCLGQSAL